MGSRTGRRSARGDTGALGIRAAGSLLRVCLVTRHGHDRAAGDGVVKGSGAGGEPPGLADGGLNFPAESGRGSGGGFVERVTVGFAEDEEVDVADGPWSLVFVEAGGP